MTKKKTLRYSAILLALGVSLSSTPFAQAVNPINNKNASGTSPYIYTSVLESLKTPEGKELNSVNELPQDVIDLVLNRKSFGNYKGTAAWAIPLNSKNSLDATDIYKDSFESKKEYQALTNDNKKRAQVAYSLLNATYQADTKDAKNVDSKILDKLKELKVDLKDKNDITAAGAILLNKAFDNNYKPAKVSSTVANAVDKLYDLAPKFKNSLNDREDIVITNSEDRVFIVTDQGPALHFDSWYLGVEGSEESAQENAVSSADNLGIYEGVSIKSDDDKVFLNSVSLDPNHTNFKNNAAYPEANKSDEAYKKLSDDKKKEAYVAASLLFNTNDEATDKKEDFSKVTAKLKELGIDEKDHNKLSAGAHLLLLDAFNDKFTIPKGTSDEVIKIYQTLKGAASSLNTDISGETITTRSKLDKINDIPEIAYLLPDNTLYRFDTLEFGEFDVDPGAGKGDDGSNGNGGNNGNNGSDNGNNNGSDGNNNSGSNGSGSDGSGSDGSGSNNNGNGSSDKDNNKDNSRDRNDDSKGFSSRSNSDSDGSGNSTTGSTVGSSSTLPNTTNGNSRTGTAVNGQTLPALQQARKDYSGTFSGGTSSSVEEGEGIDGEGSNVDTGSPTTSIINKIRTIF